MAEQELISGNVMFVIEPIEQKEKCEIQNFYIRDCPFYQLFVFHKTNF